MNRYFAHIYRFLLAFAVPLALVGCHDDDFDDNMTPEQRDLIGSAINFDASIADRFSSRTIYDDTGIFSDNDVMRIYRQYANSDGSWSESEAYRTYYYKNTMVTGTDVILESNWKVEPGRKGYNIDDGVHSAGEIVQTEADSLTWESGTTVRFRAWSRSNYYNSIISDSKNRYYPDFCIADYVNASGPTKGIPLMLNHMGSRIVFSRKNDGNEFNRIEICWEEDKWEDYKRRDNSASHDDDTSATEEGKTDEVAKAECAKVRAVYERMCMPAGVDINNRTLFAMPLQLWTDATDETIKYIENEEERLYRFGSLSADEIKTLVKRPHFVGLNGSVYLITIPYDMSTSESKGNILVLPPETRFRVYLHDVNNGDQYGTGGYEGEYHIFCLSDIVDPNDNTQKLFPNGLELVPGNSYRFYVGYQYGNLKVTAEDNFSWVSQDAAEATLDTEEEEKPVSGTRDYQWWKDAINAYIPKGTEDFNPVFTISTKKDFLEFINLVNGTATTKDENDPLRCKVTYKLDPTDPNKKKQIKEYKWYKINEITPGIGGKNDTIFYNQSDLEDEYIFYEHYHAANADKAAYSETDYLKGNYSFYDDNLNTHFKINLAADLDLSDWELATIGVNASKPFMGYFNGQGHKLTNLNMGAKGYLFGYIDGGTVTNLLIESTHKVSIAKEAINSTRFLGISLLADTRTNPIAEKISGTSYVIGCIHIGDGGFALVGEADDLYMSGCMQAAEGISNGALLGAYSAGAKSFFAPQTSTKVSWGRFMCNYYDKQLSPSAKAVGNINDSYKQLQYIRGSASYILKAKNDNLIGEGLQWNKLNATQQAAFYGLAPWKAMNYAIYKYNDQYVSKDGVNKDLHKCTMHFISNTTGYDHHYPTLTSGAAGPDDGTNLDYGKINPIEQNN